MWDCSLLEETNPVRISIDHDDGTTGAPQLVDDRAAHPPVPADDFVAGHPFDHTKPQHAADSLPEVPAVRMGGPATTQAMSPPSDRT